MTKGKSANQSYRDIPYEIEARENENIKDRLCQK